MFLQILYKKNMKNFKNTLNTGINTGKITAINPGNDNDMYNRKVSLKNSAPFFVS